MGERERTAPGDVAAVAASMDVAAASTGAASGRRWRTASARLFWSVMLLAMVLGYLLLVGIMVKNTVEGAVVLGPGAQWGTYAEESHLPGKEGGTSIGVWRSDDGATVLRPVELKGRLDDGADTARAAWVPERWAGIRGYEIVETAHWASVDVVFGALGALALVGVPVGVAAVTMRSSTRSDGATGS
ncbi:hypothetical protein [Agromyces sp. SYSU T00194]|uniref:hypothetical protein n=1 Tax=Agromyces chitinivorans TaxID=3158560 RepID=UPI0033976992